MDRMHGFYLIGRHQKYPHLDTSPLKWNHNEECLENNYFQCTFTVKKMMPGICQLRLDFNTLQLSVGNSDPVSAFRT
jgi:hypothetical protein